MEVRQVYGFGKIWFVGDFYEEDGKRREEGRGRDKAKVEEQPAVEPVAVGGQGAAEKNTMTSFFAESFSVRDI